MWPHARWRQTRDPPVSPAEADPADATEFLPAEAAMSDHARELPGLLATSEAHREAMAKAEEASKRNREVAWMLRKNVSDTLKQLGPLQAGYLSDILGTACMGEPMARARVLHELEQLGVVFPLGKGTKG